MKPLKASVKTMEPNWTNRTLWTGDNLDIMRGMNSETVDLIYLDPPFNSNRDYSAPIGSEAAGAAFKDTWTLSDVDEAWHGEIADRDPALYAIVDAAGLSHGKGMKSYLIMMAVRLLEMRRLLKPTGSIYLHCDPTASHYLKTLMDAIYGAGNFRNDIVWKRKAGRGETQNAAIRFGVTSDVLLFYARSSETILNRQYRPNNPAYIASKFTHVDPLGRRYRLDNLTSPSPRPNLVYEYKGYKPPKNGWAVSRERMKQMDREGRIYFPSDKSKRLQRIRFLDELPGETVDTLWDDIPPINSRAQERVGYPTQKPLALLDRVIRTSSNEDDMVLDPFCGCATALVAADRINRQWAGIDLSPLAARLVLKRLRDDRGPLFDDVVHREDIPRRTDLGELPNYHTHKHTLYGRQEGICGGCQVMFPFRNMTVDHIVPQTKGGSDHLDNLQLLCAACNSMKGTRPQEAFIAKLKAEGLRQ